MGFLKKIIFSFVFLAVLAPNFALAEDVPKDFGLKDAAPDSLKTGVIGGSVGIPGAVGKVISIVLSMVGILFFLIIVYAGLTWMIARGNTEKVDKSKDMIEGAVIGLIIILAAYAITKFVFENLDKGSATAQSSVNNVTVASSATCPFITGNETVVAMDGSTASVGDQLPKACNNLKVGESCGTNSGKCSLHILGGEFQLPTHCDCK